VQERRATRTQNKHKHISAQQLNIGTPQLSSAAQQRAFVVAAWFV